MQARHNRTRLQRTPPRGTPRRVSPPAQTEDTALRSLDALERAKLSMDAWEPSLLRKLLKAQHKLRR